MRHRPGRARALLLAALTILGLTLSAGAPVLALGHFDPKRGATPDDVISMPWPR